VNDGSKGDFRIVGKHRLQCGGAVRRQILDQRGGEAGSGGFALPAGVGGVLRLVGLSCRRPIFRLDQAAPDFGVAQSARRLAS
jgi:hypothetical protein